MPPADPRRRLLVAALVGALAGAGLAASPEPTGIEAFVAIRGGEVLVAENADVRLAPASVVKLLVAIAALETLGPEHRIETRLTAHGRLRDDGVLEGDLVVQAAADPTWGPGDGRDAPFGLLPVFGTELRRHGIRSVSGDLIVDVSRFPGRGAPPTRARGEVAYAVGAPTAPLAWDRGLVTFGLGPGPCLGAPAGLSPPDSGAAGGLDWENHVTTVGRERHGRGTVDVLPRWGTDGVRVEGEFPITEPVYRIEAAHPRPLESAAAVLRAAIESAGVPIAGSVRTNPPPETPSVAAVRLPSPPLAERLEPILRDSSNWHAEMLGRSLGAEVRGEGRLETGLEVVLEVLQEQAGIDEKALELDDASGVSPYDLVTARSVAEALRWAASRPWFGVLLASLPGSGEGTLRAWPHIPGLHAKTGTGRHTVALAGVLEATAGKPLLFCAITSGSPQERWAQRERILKRLRTLSGETP